MIEGLRTGHVGINVSELERSREFYSKAFRLEVMSESRESEREFVFLGLDKTLVLTLWQQAQGAIRPRAAGPAPSLISGSYERRCSKRRITTAPDECSPDL